MRKFKRKEEEAGSRRPYKNRTGEEKKSGLWGMSERGVKEPGKGMGGGGAAAGEAWARKLIRKEFCRSQIIYKLTLHQ